MKFSPSHHTKTRGFTIVEMMVASSLFIAVVLVGTTAISSVYKAYNAQRVERQAINQLGSVVDLIARQMMTGLVFHCYTGDGNTSPTFANLQNRNNAKNCFAPGASGGNVAFFDEDGRAIRYRVRYSNGVPLYKNVLYRSIYTGSSWPSDSVMLDTYNTSDTTTNRNSTYTINSQNIYVRGANQNSFYHASSDKKECKPVQPFALIRFTVISGGQRFLLQTGVTMRKLDLPTSTTPDNGCPVFS